MPLKLLDNYLRPRHCNMEVNGHFLSNRQLAFSVPQGSCAGQMLFTAYSSTMPEVIPKQISIYGYADDHGLKKSNRPVQHEEEETIKQLEMCVVEIEEWMDTNRLHMNSKKTEYITFGSSKQFMKNNVKSININGDPIASITCIRYLGVWADQQLAQKCKTAMLNMQRLKKIWKFLIQEAACVIAQGLIISDLDYCNSIYAGLPASTIAPLGWGQVMCTKLILGISKYHSTSECWQTLHWLPNTWDSGS